jgi:gas vesicle protein
MRRNRDVVYVERDGGTLKWLALGAALGAGVALLFAPRSGRELRRELGEGLRRIRAYADETLEEIRDELSPDEEKLRTMGDSADAWEGEEEEEEAEAPPPPRHRPRRRTALTARDELERRLEAARARRRPADDEGPEDEEPVA